MCLEFCFDGLLWSKNRSLVLFVSMWFEYKFVKCIFETKGLKYRLKKTRRDILRKCLIIIYVVCTWEIIIPVIRVLNYKPEIHFRNFVHYNNIMKGGNNCNEVYCEMVKYKWTTQAHRNLDHLP